MPSTFTSCSGGIRSSRAQGRVRKTRSFTLQMLEAQSGVSGGHSLARVHQAALKRKTRKKVQPQWSMNMSKKHHPKQAELTALEADVKQLEADFEAAKADGKELGKDVYEQFEQKMADIQAKIDQITAGAKAELDKLSTEGRADADKIEATVKAAAQKAAADLKADAEALKKAAEDTWQRLVNFVEGK